MPVTYGKRERLYLEKDSYVRYIYLHRRFPIGFKQIQNFMAIPNRYIYPKYLVKCFVVIDKDPKWEVQILSKRRKNEDPYVIDEEYPDPYYAYSDDELAFIIDEIIDKIVLQHAD